MADQKEKENMGQDQQGHNIMISYCWAQKDLVHKIYNELTQAGYHIWIDKENMRGLVFDAMANAVEEAEIMLICMSKEYEKSENCKREATFATVQKKKIIPLNVQSSYTPGGWLGFILENRLWYDFTNKSNFSVMMQQLITALTECKIIPGAGNTRRQNPEPIQGPALYVFAGVNEQTRLEQLWAAPLDAGRVAGEFRPLASIPEPKSSAGCAVVGGVVYIAGGLDSDFDHTDSCWAFNPNTASWTKAPTLSEKKDGLTLTAVGSLLVAIGGMDDDDDTVTTCESLHIEDNGCTSDSWQTGIVPELPLAVSDHATCEHNGWLYITGGVTEYVEGCENKSTETVYRWKANEAAWEGRQNLMKTRCDHGMASNDKHIFVFGGSRRSSAEMYDESTNQWTRLVSMPGPQKQARVNFISDVIYVTGCKNKVYIYHPDKQQWRTDEHELPWKGELNWPCMCVIATKAQPASEMPQQTTEDVEGSDTQAQQQPQQASEDVEGPDTQTQQQPQLPQQASEDVESSDTQAQQQPQLPQQASGDVIGTASQLSQTYSKTGDTSQTQSDGAIPLADQLEKVLKP